MLTVSELARKKVVEFIQEEKDETGENKPFVLRVAVEGGGCSGLQYNLTIDEKRDTDHTFNFDSFEAVMDPNSKEVLAMGIHIDYVEALTNAGFKIHNPLATNTCECGNSFEV